MNAPPTSTPHDCSADSPDRLAGQLYEIAREKPGEEPFSEIMVTFYRCEIDTIIEALRRPKA